MNITTLARKNIQSLKPYSSARMEASSGEVFLNANEMPWPGAGQDDQNIHRYPDPQPAELMSLLADYYQRPADSILASRGSDEAIDLLVRVFCEPELDRITICPPTFGMYEVAAKIQNCAVNKVPLTENFELDTRSIIQGINEGSKLVFLCSPNNPTGQRIKQQQIISVLDAAKQKAIVVIDEAYAEFDTETSIPLINEYPHLVVLRTFSKAHALAGTRFGVALAQAELIKLLRKVLPPYPLPRCTIDTMLTALKQNNLSSTRQGLTKLIEQREWMAEQLKQCDSVVTVYPSSSNFLLVRFEDASLIKNCCDQVGLILRDQSSQPGLENCLRITIGTEQQNRKVLEAISA